MQTFTSILVDIDSTVPAQPALERAVRLARSCGAKLTIADVIAVPVEARAYVSVQMAEELMTRRHEQLRRVTMGVTTVAAESKLLVGRPATALIKEVLRSGHDLLIRSHARGLVASKPYGAVDMELFRKCPCPVLVVGPGVLPEHPRIVCAVHPCAEDQSEHALNVKIVELTLLMARLEQGSPTLLQAWMPYMEGKIRSHVSGDAFVAYVEAARSRAAADLAHLTGSLDGRLSSTPVALRRGRPDEVIAEFVVAEGIDLVVMGTVARAGIAGLLIGNTAERVLRTLPCSVLAVKPDGFVSPVGLEGPD